MKILSTFILMLMMAKGCTNSELKKESENVSFEYEAFTRGNYKKIIAKQDTLFTIKSRDGKANQNNLAKSDWNSILKIASKIDRTKITSLKAPTERRFYDGAMIAKLTVFYNKETFESPAFDHGNPPEEIKDLVNKMIEVSKIEKE